MTTGSCGCRCGEPGRRQVHQFVAVFEAGFVGGNRDGHQLSAGRDVTSLALVERCGQIGLAGQGPGGHLVPQCRDRGEVADPEVDRHAHAPAGTQRDRGHRGGAPAPVAAAPAQRQHGRRQSGQPDPYPQFGRCGITREALRMDEPAGPRRQAQADRDRTRQPDQAPAPGAPADRRDQRHGRDHLQRGGQPTVQQRHASVRRRHLIRRRQHRCHVAIFVNGSVSGLCFQFPRARRGGVAASRCRPTPPT